MSKFKIKGVWDNQICSLEYDRGTSLQIRDVKVAFERKFGARNATLSYKYSDGKLQPLYQDFHLQDAFKDAEKSNFSFLTLDVEAQPLHLGPSTSSFQSVRTASPISNRLSSQISPSPNRPKFCESCGAPRSPTAKFCPECGHKATPVTSPAASRPPSTSVPGGGMTCAGCGNVATGSLVKALNRIWHKDCFTCNNCHKILEGSFVAGENGMPMCATCYSSQFSKLCAACNNPINSAYLIVEGRNYHKGCFVCSVCSSPFSGGYMMKDGRPTCQNCF